jgi:hypothetical protein
MYVECSIFSLYKKRCDHKRVLRPQVYSYGVWFKKKQSLKYMVMRIQSYWIFELNIEAGHRWWSVFPFPVYTFFLMHDVYFVWTKHIWFIFFFFFNLSIPGVVVIDLFLLLTFYTLLFNHAFKLVMCVCVCVCVCSIKCVCVCVQCKEWCWAHILHSNLT